MEHAFPDWLSLWAVQSIWWTFGFFFIAAITEMLFPPFPGDAVLFLGMITLQTSEIPVARGVIAATLGGLAGFALLFWFGRSKGRAFFIKRDKGIFSLERLHKVEAWFKKWGALVIIFGRFLAGVRSAVPVVAGVGDYPVARTMIFGGISVLLWNVLLAVFAVALHENWDQFKVMWQRYNLLIWIVVGIIVLVVMWRVNRPNKTSGAM